MTPKKISSETETPNSGERPVRKHIGFRAYAGTFGTSVMVQGLTVLQAILIARLLGRVGRGEYAAVILWPTVFAAIGIFGTNIALARAAARTGQYHEVVRTSILLGLISSAITSILCYFTLPYLLPDENMHLLAISRLFVVFIVLNHMALNLITVDQGVGNFRRFNFTRAVLYPVYIMFLLGMWQTGNRQVKWAAVGLLIANMTALLVQLFLILRNMKLWGKFYSPLKAIRQSVRFALVGAAMPLYFQADRAILLWLLGTENLGLYVAALSASAAVGSITNSASLVSFTAAAQADHRQGFEVLARTFRMSLLLWMFFGGILALAMPLLLPLVYGAEFSPAINPARLLIAGSAFAGLANLLDQSMRGQGRAFVGLEGRLAGIAVMIILGIALAPDWGLMGMCLVFVLAQSICMAILACRTLRHYGTQTGLKCFIPGPADVVYGLNRILTVLRSQDRNRSFFKRLL